jgi:hypothetical protein
MLPTGLSRRVAAVVTDVLEVMYRLHHKGEKIGELVTTLAVTNNRSTLLDTFSETLVIRSATRRHIPGNGILLISLCFRYI